LFLLRSPLDTTLSTLKLPLVCILYGTTRCFLSDWSQHVCGRRRRWHRRNHIQSRAASAGERRGGVTPFLCRHNKIHKPPTSAPTMAGPSSSSSSSSSSSPSSSRQKRDLVLHRTARTVLLLLSLSIALTTLYQIYQVRIPAIQQQQQQQQQQQHQQQQQQQQQYEVHDSGNDNTTFYQLVQTPAAGNNYSLVVYIVNVRPGIEYSVVVTAPDRYVRAAMQQEKSFFPPQNGNTTTTTRTLSDGRPYISFTTQLPVRPFSTVMMLSPPSLYTDGGATTKTTTTINMTVLVHETWPDIRERREKDSVRVLGPLGSTAGESPREEEEEGDFSIVVPLHISSSDPVSASAPMMRSPCQSLSPDSLISWDGDWFGPRLFSSSPLLSSENDDENSTRNVQHLRNGWTFAPRHCILETFTTQDMWAISKQQRRPAAAATGTDDVDAAAAAGANSDKTVIAIWGTSRERGVFLSLVDMMLVGAEKSDLEYSGVAKCWGRASIRLNDLELVYQDLRTQLCNPTEPSGTISCHGDKVAQGSGYMQNTTAMIREWFDPTNITDTSSQSPDRPTVVLMFSGCSVYHFNQRPIDGVTVHPHWCMQSTAQILTALPTDWNGTVYLTTVMIAADNTELTRDEYQVYLHNIRWFHDHYLAHDPRIRLLDLYGIATDMRLQAERPNKIHASTHQHRWCNELDGSMRVCSNVTEAIANLLIGRAVAPRGKAVWRRENSEATQHWLSITSAASSEASLAPQERMIRVCTDCPQELLPFHMKITPEFQCRDGGLVTTNQTAGAVWNTPHCPAFCMTLEPVGQQKTQSGPVDIRKCVLGDDSTVQRQ
jgi:hypothetical protein